MKRDLLAIAVFTLLVALVPLVTSSGVLLNFTMMALYAALMAQAWNLLGGYGGARIGRRAPPGVVRGITLLATFCITLVFFVKTYAPALLQR